MKGWNDESETAIDDDIQALRNAIGDRLQDGIQPAIRVTGYELIVEKISTRSWRVAIVPPSTGGKTATLVIAQPSSQRALAECISGLQWIVMAREKTLVIDNADSNGCVTSAHGGLTQVIDPSTGRAL